MSIGTKLKMSKAYHPQTDGQTERTNRTLEQVLRAVCSHNQQEWDVEIPAVQLAFNSAESATTKMSPFYCLYGREVATPTTLLLLSNLHNVSAQSLRETIATNIQRARENIALAQDRQAKYANVKRKDQGYVMGD